MSNRLTEVFIVRKQKPLHLDAVAGSAGMPMHIPVSAGSASSQAIVQEVSATELSDLRRDQDVEAVVPTVPLRLIAPLAASVAKKSATSTEAWGLAAVRATTSEFSGKGVTVAVLDTGIDKNHPAFVGVELITKNFTSEGAAKNVTDKHGHGTHCAGTIFGRDVNGQRIGIARGVERAIIGKVLGEGGGSTGTLYSAINWAIENGAHVVSMSLGMDFVGLRERLAETGIPQEAATTEILRLVIANVRFFDNFARALRDGASFGRSALVIAASGNESHREDTPSYALGAAFPAETQEFVSVGAVERTDDTDKPYRVAWFSNAGAKCAAPGVDILSAAPGGGLVSMNGTSMATPHVAGVAALWYQKLMNASGKITPTKVWEKMLTSAKLFDGLDEADVGSGIPQAPQK